MEGSLIPTLKARLEAALALVEAIEAPPKGVIEQLEDPAWEDVERSRQLADTLEHWALDSEREGRGGLSQVARDMAAEDRARAAQMGDIEVRAAAGLPYATLFAVAATVSASARRTSVVVGTAMGEGALLLPEQPGAPVPTGQEPQPGHSCIALSASLDRAFLATGFGAMVVSGGEEARLEEELELTRALLGRPDPLSSWSVEPAGEEPPVTKPSTRP